MNNLEKNNIDDEGLIFLHKLPLLKVLNLESNRITSLGVEILCIGDYPQLHSLTLNYNPVGDEGMKFLSKLDRLEKL